MNTSSIKSSDDDDELLISLDDDEDAIYRAKVNFINYKSHQLNESNLNGI